MKYAKWTAIAVCLGIFVVFAPLWFGKRSLTDQERQLAISMFAEGLNLDPIKIREGGVLTWVYPAVTTGNTISFPTGAYDPNDRKDQALLLHELTHVWQFQHHGLGYMPRALYEEITQPDAYVVHYDPSKTFGEYDIEEQAEIVAEYFLTGNASYEPYLQEIRSAREK